MAPHSSTLATWCQELTHLKRPWCWQRLRAGGEGDDTRWDGWMTSPTRWTWVWASSRSWWWTGKPGVLQSMGSKSRDRPEWRKKNNYTHIYATGSLCCTPQTLQINHASVKICVPTDKISGFSIASMTWVKYQFKDYWLYISKQQLYVENMNFDII